MRRLGRWFWSPVRADENSAQTIVRVLGNLSRTGLTFALVCLIAFVGFVVYSTGQSATGADAAAAERDSIRVRASIVGDEDLGEICSEAYPLIVAVTNNSDKALMSMSVDLTARDEGSSANKLDFLDDQIHWDIIVPPHHRYYQCWSVKPEHRRRVFSGKVAPYSIVLEPVAEWMLKETKAFKIERQAEAR